MSRALDVPALALFDHDRRADHLVLRRGAEGVRYGHLGGIAAPALARGRVRVRVQAFDEVGHSSHISSAGLAPGPR